ncbi:MAG: hypothetical protein HOL70_08725 [Candidatus Marinimicrobia bacterium]|jgi:orotate phosphoribosyltransferase|nr:hypothetical protein [Bacteroidota bacterium]MBT5269515.1 hypothetical protein [Candidatus Neomarinimicrobiota bacterium]
MAYTTFNDRVSDLFKEVSALEEGHFEYDSGLHGEIHFEKRNIITRPAVLEELAGILADYLISKNVEIDVVCSPAVGGVPFALFVSLHMKCRFVFCDRKQSLALSLRNKFAPVVQGQRILFIDDNLTTGTTLKESCRLLEKYDAQVVHAGFIADVCSKNRCLPVQVTALLSQTDTAWQVGNCPLCEKGVPMGQKQESE